METNYLLIQDLSQAVDTIPEQSIVSRTLYKDKSLKAILFAFAPGQELSEHTASVPAIIHILEGEADLKLGEDSVNGVAGTWAHMPPHLPHSLYARTPVKMLLTMLSGKE